MDIRDHGGGYGNSGLKVIGKKIELTALTPIKKGQFIGIPATAIDNLNPPSFVAVSGGGKYIASDSNMNYEYKKSITSDAGNTIILWTNNRVDNYQAGFTKPYTNTSGYLSIEQSKIELLYGYIFSITKMDSNTFAIFHSYERNTTKGLQMSVIKIDDATGEPSYLSKNIVFNTTAYHKNFYYIPTDSSKKTGIVLYSTGSYSVGYSDSTTGYYAKISISSDYKSISTLNSAVSTQYVSNESYGPFSNLIFLKNEPAILFRHVNKVYKLDYSTMSLTQTYNYSNSSQEGYYDSINTFDALFHHFESNSFLTFSSIGAGNLYEISTKNVSVGKVTRTTAYTSDYFHGFLTEGVSVSIVDVDFLQGKLGVMNPIFKKKLIPVGNNTYIGISNERDSSTGVARNIRPFALYMEANLKSVRTIKVGNPVFGPVTQYFTGGGPTVVLNEDLSFYLFASIYDFIDGQGSFRYHYSRLGKLSINIPSSNVTANYINISGIALNSGNIGDKILCLIESNSSITS